MHSLFIFIQSNLQQVHKYDQCGILNYNDEIRIFAIFKIPNEFRKRRCSTHTHFAFFIQCLNHIQTKPLLFIAFYERTNFFAPANFCEMVADVYQLKTRGNVFIFLLGIPQKPSSKVTLHVATFQIKKVTLRKIVQQYSIRAEQTKSPINFCYLFQTCSALIKAIIGTLPTLKHDLVRILSFQVFFFLAIL